MKVIPAGFDYSDINSFGDIPLITAEIPRYVSVPGMINWFGDDKVIPENSEIVSKSVFGKNTTVSLNSSLKGCKFTESVLLQDKCKVSQCMFLHDLTIKKNIS